MVNSLSKNVSFLIGLLLLSGCAAPYDVTNEINELQDRFHSLGDSIAYQYGAETYWWKSFNDPQLNQLVDEVISANRDFKAAGKRIQAAYQQFGFEKAQYLPQGNVDGTFTRQAVGSQEHNTSSFVANTDWEVDLFGRISYTVEAAYANAIESKEVQRQVYVEVVAGTVANYISWQGNIERHRIISGQIKSLEESVEMLQIRVDEGISTTLDLHRTEAQLNQLKAILPSVEADIYRNRSTLATLLAKNSEMVELEPVAYNLDENIHQQLQLTTPEKAVAQRPDIHIAMQKLIGQNASSNVAVAALYPTISLSGFAGIVSESSSSIFEGDGAWSITPKISWSILSLPALNARAKAERSLTEAAYVDYEQVIINAVADSQTAIVDFQKSSVVAENSAKRLKHASKAFDQVQVMYEEGAVLYLEVLDARRVALTAEGDMNTSKTDMLLAKVSAYRAFNGGWSQEAYVLQELVEVN